MILDIVGGPNIERNFKAASHDARIIQLAFALGSKVEVNLMPVMLKRLTYTGSTLRTRPPAFKARVARELEAQVWPHIEAGRIRVVTRQTYPARARGRGPRGDGKRRAHGQDPAGRVAAHFTTFRLRREARLRRRLPRSSHG